MMAATPTVAGAVAAEVQELSIETILAHHSELNGKIVRFRGRLVSGGMGNQALCSGDTPQAKCLWFGGSGIFRDALKRDPGAKRFIVQGRLNDECIRQACTDMFAEIEDATIVSQY
ncbi:MAG: hypothetical protein J0I47_10010 [Sphingomonas sp.]|uniref:hypothetical protein n=1 Tax=Sphingomonas sp. TaxID=28214 RepID=UPI001AD1A541|nr:hypothetical protein [Sphingomonas sp.]MBN8808548.1 hypothetical protein [Sphingomonas sp.]